MSGFTDARVTSDEARHIAEETFLFGLPLVYMSVEAAVATSIEKPDGSKAPFNQFAHFREFPDASNRQIVGLNVDTLYSLASLDLTSEPIVLSVPEMKNRWWLMQLLDAWNDVPGAPGTRTVGSDGGNFALVGPNCAGRLPPGLTEYRIDTNLCMIGGRTYTAGKADYAAVNAIQDQYRLTPLSMWGTDYTPPASVPIKPDVDAATPVPAQVFAMTADQFFGRLCDMLVGNPARAADAPVMARAARLGIAPGARFDLGAFGADVRSAVEEGIAAGQQAVRAEQAHMGEIVNGWQIARDLGHYGTRYGYRAAWTFFAVGGNLVEDAVYPLALSDADGRTLNGSNRYELRFERDQVPPVNAFWSLTMYDGDSYLVDNAQDRYALGDRDPLTFGPDGSLTLYLQSEPPGPGKEDNWLPGPKEGEFKVALRLYGPKEQVADGTWQPPPVRRTSL